MEITSEDDYDNSEYKRESPTFDKNFKRYGLPRTNKIKSKKLCAKELKTALLKKIAVILQKCASERTLEEEKVLNNCLEEVREVKTRWKRRDDAKKRLEEYEDSPDVLQTKCEKLAQAIAQAQHLVIYTGAGISTSAKIPDYRGPNGIWTRLQQGKDIGNHDLTSAEPTFTHMALSELYKRNILKYVVSQNCDGLHLRSGLPRTALSELHGNMYLEVCKNCKPHKEYWRLFDVTENTSRYFHKTSRKCYTCNSPLLDTIVHFGEKGTLQWPLNWKGACSNASKATTILCLGSSLRVLKKYPWLWQMGKPPRKRPNLYIVNLQWTPKDDCANVKINGRCDEVMQSVMKCLGIQTPPYDRNKDPIYFHSTALSELEIHTTTQPPLKELLVKDEKDEVSEMPLVKNSHHEEEKDCIESHRIDDLNKIPSASPTTVQQDFCDNIYKSANQGTKIAVDESLPMEEGSSLLLNNISNAANVLNRSFSIVCSSNVNSQLSLQNHLNKFIYNPFINFGNYNNNYFREFCESAADYYYYSYPYQSSWLYSGLHSIINPIPFIKEEIKIEEVKIAAPTCEFCYKNLKTMECSFYVPNESVFLKQEYRFSKLEKQEKPNICVCCDYTTDEDEVNGKEDENKEKNQTEKRVQPGWFGKGYKKGRYKRK